MNVVHKYAIPGPLILGCMILLPGLSSSSAQTGGSLPPIKELKTATPNKQVFGESTRDKPIVISSKKEAAKYFEPNSLEKLLKQVNLSKQVIFIFAWRGSGQDQISYTVQESFPEQVAFIYKPGRTRDLRPHVRVYALRNNVKWKGKPARPAPPMKSEQDSVKLEVRGTLNTGSVAIGGETTGITISANGKQWELSFGKNVRLRKLASELNQKKVIIKGELFQASGVERKNYWVIRVTSLRKAP